MIHWYTCSLARKFFSSLYYTYHTYSQQKSYNGFPGVVDLQLQL